MVKLKLTSTFIKEIILLLACISFGCDGYLILKGTLKEPQSSETRINNAKIKLYYALPDSSFKSARVYEMVNCDSIGSFRWDGIVPPTFTKKHGAVLTQAETYEADTVIFGYRSGDSVSVQILLRRK
jgi:hypothetical protein